MQNGCRRKPRAKSRYKTLVSSVVAMEGSSKITKRRISATPSWCRLSGCRKGQNEFCRPWSGFKQREQITQGIPSSLRTLGILKWARLSWAKLWCTCWKEYGCPDFLSLSGLWWSQAVPPSVDSNTQSKTKSHHYTLSLFSVGAQGCMLFTRPRSTRFVANSCFSDLLLASHTINVFLLPQMT